MVRATKNRFGVADEVGCFEMTEAGMVGLPDPSGLFLSDRSEAIAGTCVTVTLEGRRPLVTEIQALVNRTSAPSPRRSVSDLDSARLAMLCAILTRHGPDPLHDHEVYAATVGGMPAREPAADLAVLLALASAASGRPIPVSVCAIGEVSLSGDVRRVSALPRRLAEAARLGFTTALVPAGHTEIGAAEQIRTIPVATVLQAIWAGTSARDGGSRRASRPVLPHD
jgi:DNA repair protein RadA/Sms